LNHRKPIKGCASPARGPAPLVPRQRNADEMAVTRRAIGYNRAKSGPL